MAGGLLSTENCKVLTAQFIRPPRSAAEPGIAVSLTAPFRSALPNGIVSPVVRARVMAGRSTTKTPHNPIGIVGRKGERPLPYGAVQLQRKTLLPRGEWHMRAKCWAQAGQSMPSLALWATLVSVAFGGNYFACSSSTAAMRV